MPNNSNVINTKPNMQAVKEPTKIYQDTVVITSGMWMGMGLFTYPTTGTIQQTRL